MVVRTRARPKPTPAIAVERSGNHKTGETSITYASQATCPDGSNGTTRCAAMGEGCYAESGPMAWTTRRLNAADVHDIVAAAIIEAHEIDALSGTRRLRLHGVGDCTTDETALIVSSAADRFTAKHGQPSWTYTHAWREVNRSSWQGVNVSASCETEDDITAAKAKGYSTAVVFNADVVPAGATFRMGDHRVVKCPQQRGMTNCEGCTGLCTDTANMIRHNITVGFATHGTKRGAMNSMLQSRS